MNDRVTDPDARSWDELKTDFDFTPDERREIADGAQRLIAEAQAFRTSEAHRPSPTDEAQPIGGVRSGQDAAYGG